VSAGRHRTQSQSCHGSVTDQPVLKRRIAVMNGSMVEFTN